ncbi:MAG: sn-glycerol-3-phosphate ABC transporter ATP-binding protein UgpC [Hyphomicrobiaceae bacterium]|nr:sn-glycerol-3-phosphate ABC transporter ATP-binding protein UgpC [Hyphomicrobiaceae bacterium]
MAEVRLSQIEKFYGAVKVIHGIDAVFEDGEFVALVGPSGCGKSTLLRMIAGLEEITVGDIYIGEKLVNDLAPKARDIAMVFQNYALYPHMTVADNMGFSLKLSGEPKQNRDRRVNEVAEILGLQDLLGRYPRQLSGGQRQRVAMGRAIVRDPQVFLFDEPLSNLDAKLRISMRGEIKQLHQRLKTTTIFVTHDQIEAMTMADRIVVMNDGRVEQVGTPIELFDRPKNLFVAEFIGSPSMNLLSGKIEKSASKNVFRTAGGESLPVMQSLSAGDEVVYGVRPEHLTLSRTGVEAEVIIVEPTGSETQVVFALGTEKIVGLFRERVTAQPGDLLKILPDPDQIHLFDRATGDRL